mgnify:FL=1
MRSFLLYQGHMSYATLTNYAIGKAFFSEHLASHAHTSIFCVIFFLLLHPVWSLINFVCTVFYSSLYMYIAAGLLYIHMHVQTHTGIL